MYSKDVSLHDLTQTTNGETLLWLRDIGHLKPAGVYWMPYYCNIVCWGLWGSSKVDYWTSGQIEVRGKVLYSREFPCAYCFRSFPDKTYSRRDKHEMGTWSTLCRYLRLITLGTNSSVTELQPVAGGNPPVFE